MNDELEVRHVYEPGDDTEDRVRRAVAILLAEEPHKRPEGEAA